MNLNEMIEAELDEDLETITETIIKFLEKLQ